jgi:hypothetical protein
VKILQNKTIAVEGGLTQIKQALEQAGFTTVAMDQQGNQGDFRNASMIVVSGMNDNLMGIQDTDTKAPVISAAGLTAEEVVRIAKERLH